MALSFLYLMARRLVGMLLGRSSGSGCQRPPSEQCSCVMDFGQHLDGRPPHGEHFFVRRPPPSWPPTCFTVATVCRKTLYVWFLIELHTRRVRLAGVTDHPNGPWMVQRARELSMNREGAGRPGFLIRDRDSKFTRAYDDVFASDGVQTIKTPIQAPNANAVAERWVRTIRQECLDWLLILSRGHLARVLDEYLHHYNDQRPHRSLDLAPPTVINGDPCRRLSGPLPASDVWSVLAA